MKALKSLIAAGGLAVVLGAGLGATPAAATYWGHGYGYQPYHGYGYRPYYRHRHWGYHHRPRHYWGHYHRPRYYGGWGY